MFGGKVGLPELFILCPLLGLFLVWAAGWWKIFPKAGYSGALSLAMLIPIVSFIVFFWFAFTRWPIEQYERSSISRS